MPIRMPNRERGQVSVELLLLIAILVILLLHVFNAIS